VANREVEFLLIGGGLASGNCARHLREQGADGAIVLVGREPHPPYSRPPLSKGYLRGEEPWEEVRWRPDEWWPEQRIELLTRTTVTALDPAARVATLSDKQEIRFEKARGTRCDRCWKVTPEADETGLCDRCRRALEALERVGAVTP